MDSKLKQCPFCGGAVQLEKTHKSHHEIYGERQWWGVRCTNNVNVGGTCAVEAIPTASPEAAAERWNRRAPAIAPPVAAGSVDIEQVLRGIDQDETESDGGWWETSDGANIGKKKKAEILAWGAQQREEGRQEAQRETEDRIGNLIAVLSDEKKRAEKAEALAAHKQSIIDRLMLEYCPNEMTVEQMEEWASHQKRAE